jgi:hypothetical protein
MDLAREVENSSGLALVPALIILTVVFVFHQRGKRQEARAQAATAEADARQAGARASEMERLASFGHALGARSTATPSATSSSSICRN